MSPCPRCAVPRQQREGAYFVCPDCRWQWTVSITGQVYVQHPWPGSPDALESTARSVSLPPLSAADDAQALELLDGIDGLAERLAGPWAEAAAAALAWAALRQAGLQPREIERLRITRAAAEAGYYTEGVPLDQLRTEGISRELPPAAGE